jgi:hypothetical protein
VEDPFIAIVFEPQFSLDLFAIIEGKYGRYWKEQQELGRKSANLLTQMLMGLFRPDVDSHDSFSPRERRTRAVRGAFNLVQGPRQA